MGSEDEDEENELEDAEAAVLACADASLEDLTSEGDPDDEYWREFRKAENMMLSAL